jgi:hypothetical protein
MIIVLGRVSVETQGHPYIRNIEWAAGYFQYFW